MHEALAQYREALRLAPSHLSARYNLGKALQRLGEFEAARECFETLCTLAPGDAGAWTALGLARQDAGKSEEALAAWRRALDLEPGYAEAHNGIGTLHMERGAFSEAETAFRAAAAQRPAILPGIREPGADAPDRSCGYGARGTHPGVGGTRRPARRCGGPICTSRSPRPAKISATTNRPFTHYREGNRRRRRHVRFEREAAGRRAEAFASAFGRELLVGLRRSWGPEPAADFHRWHAALGHQPRGADPGQPPGLLRGRRTSPPQRPRTLASRTRPRRGKPIPLVRGISRRPTAAALGRAYLDALPAAARGAARVTDKMPANYLHLGLAALILPGARVIRCRRGAMDVCFSIYAQHFTHRDAYPYAYDLEDIASEYLACERLMAHWTRTLPLAIHEVRYEGLVDGPEKAIADLLAFCGLPFDERCLRFHETERRVNTASNWQVRQPLYRASLARWRRFERHLAPLRAALGDAD